MPHFPPEIAANLHLAGSAACLVLGLGLAALLIAWFRRGRQRGYAAQEELKDSEAGIERYSRPRWMLLS